MNERILKFANRIYKIFKVYVALAVGGALCAVVVQLILAKPFAVLVAIGSILMTSILLWTQVHFRKRKARSAFITNASMRNLK